MMSAIAPGDFRLHLESLSKSFGRRLICQDVTLELTIGESLAIVGPNGSGKSTMIRMIAGLLRPDQGAVRHIRDGQPIRSEQWHEHVAMVSPDLALYEELTARENFEFARDVGRWQCGRSDLDELLGEFGLNGRGDDPVATYSSGMRQRLKFVLAFSKRPALLLLDEPTITLDEDGTARVWDALARRRVTLVVATNDPSEAKRSARQLAMGHKEGTEVG